jgi:hypothetical protein
MSIAEGRASSRKAKQRKGKEEKPEIGHPEGIGIPRFLGRHSENKRKDKRRNSLKREGNREAKHDSRMQIDKGNTGMI